jgi:hypothetical protein
MSSVLRNVIFKSNAFNTTEPKDYFINPCCFGDDLGRWTIQRLRSHGVSTDNEPGQEDFGWYIVFRIGATEYFFIISYRPDDPTGDWMCGLERNAGLIGNILGRQKKGIQSEAAQTIHDVLKAAPEISDIRWLGDDDSEENAKPEPVSY